MDVLGRAVLESSGGEVLTTVGGPNIFNVTLSLGCNDDIALSASILYFYKWIFQSLSSNQIRIG